MARKRVATGLAGILALDKPLGVSSHDVVNTVRRVTGERRVGHAGTLDPLATGLLLVCVGPATRLADYLMQGTKTYGARVCFGAQTNTDDSEGEVIASSAVPAHLNDAAFAQQTLDELTGALEQIPPAFSAIKKDGVTAYKAARAGEALQLEARSVELYDATIVAAGSDFWDVELVVSKGFYVRSFARDLGLHLGTVAHIGSLRRTASGTVSVDEAVEVAGLLPEEPLPFIDPCSALGLPVVSVDALQAAKVHNGMTITLSSEQVAGASKSNDVLASIVHDSKLLALYEPVSAATTRGGLYKPRVVIPGGVDVPSYHHA